MHKQAKSYRLRGYDYTQGGYYFVTICTKDRNPWFGEMTSGGVALSKIGQVVKARWSEIPQHFVDVDLDQWNILPDHLHGIIELSGVNANTPWRVPTGVQPLTPGSLSVVINQFKGAVTRWCRQNGYPEFAWQSRYHDRILRDEQELQRTRHYIHYNAIKDGMRTGQIINLPWEG